MQAISKRQKTDGAELVVGGVPVTSVDAPQADVIGDLEWPFSKQWVSLINQLQQQLESLIMNHSAQQHRMSLW